MGVAAFGVVRHGAAKLLAGDFFSGDGLDDGRTGDVHDPRAFDHEDVVGERRAVDGSSRRGSRYDADLRDDSAADGVPVEDVSISVEGVHRFLDPRSPAVVDSYDRASGGEGEVHDFADFRRVHFSQRTPQYGEVLAVDVHFTALNQSPPRDDSVCVVFRLLKPKVGATVTDKFIHLDKTARVQKLLYPLPRRPLSLLLLLRYGLRPSASLRFFVLLQQLFAQLVYVPV